MRNESTKSALVGGRNLNCIHSEMPRKTAFKAASIIAVVFFLLILLLSPQRVGDGSEYYALFFAIRDGHRAYMTTPAWAGYEHLFTKSHILGLVDSASLRNMFPSLAQTSGADFNHFWFYSALAAATGGWLNLMGVSVHTSFLILHTLLLAILIYIASRNFGKFGLLSVVVILIGSPIFWFVDKVHTEFFTFCCVSIGTILLCRLRYFSAALWLALASTQNISIGATAFFLLCVGACDAGVGVWGAHRRALDIRDVALIFLTLALIVIHPIYYFFRVGVIDPQLLDGGAKIGFNFKNTYVWLLDPDVGLIPNWPMSIAIIVATVAGILVARLKSTRVIIAYFVIFIGSNLYAQSSTTNFNSGATIDVARYATWYIGLFIPSLVFILRFLSFGSKWPTKTAVAFLLLFFCITSAAHFYPAKHETYLAPTAFSAWIQRRFPTLYDPPTQIFAERNSGRAQLPASYAVLGPGCRKVLVVSLKGVPVVPFAGNSCGLDASALPSRILYPGRLSNQLPDGRSEEYMLLSEVERSLAVPTLKLSQLYETGIGKPFISAALSNGWQQREGWGVWSSGDHSQLEAKIVSCPPRGLHMRLEIIAFVSPKNPKLTLQINAPTAILFNRTLESAGPMPISFDVPCSALADGKLDLTFRYKGEISPLQLGLSVDSRVLAIGLKSILLQPQGAQNLTTIVDSP